MVDWFNHLELFPKIYWSIALLGSIIFIIMMVLTFIGGETDSLDTDTEIESDTGIGFQFITFKNLIG
ncbi:MAG TPA: hypothetical protein VF985_06170, partial [Mariniflexile sp.]